MISEGERLLVAALRPTPAVPAARRDRGCHSTSPDAASTDWREIAALYGS
jgi:predicted RNA polymerase sigma factor